MIADYLYNEYSYFFETFLNTTQTKWMELQVEMAKCSNIKTCVRFAYRQERSAVVGKIIPKKFIYNYIQY